MNSLTPTIPDPSSSNNWFVCSQASTEAETLLFLFPYAGGGPAVFNKWFSGFPSDMELWIAHYPGRGSRHPEPPINDLDLLVEALAQAIQPLLKRPAAFFGHSMGALVAFELARYLAQNKLPQPTIVFVSACRAPHLADPQPPIHALPEREFVRALQKLNGIPSELLRQPEAMQWLLPTLRADFEAFERYHYTPRLSPLGIPILAFGGWQDPRVNRADLEGWATHTNSGFRSQYFPGDHFFIETARESMMDRIATEIRAALSYAKR